MLLPCFPKQDVVRMGEPCDHHSLDISHSHNTIAHANARRALVNCLCVALTAAHLPLAEEMGCHRSFDQ